MNKKRLFRGIATIAVFFSFQVLSAQTIKVTLLGTGAPIPSIERFGPATLVEAGGQKFLFDCGRGTAQRIWQSKISLGEVNSLFLTHLHSDHIVGIPDLWLTGWIPATYGRRSVPLNVWGPTGTREMMDGLVKAYSWDTKTRNKEKNKDDNGILVNATDISQGVIYQKDGITITAFIVDHADFIDSALGFRLDYKDRSVVLSGDTRYSENLVQHAKGADVLIHEVAVANEESMRKYPLINQILCFHTSPEEAGKVFEKVKPKLAVYSHIVLLTGDKSIPPPNMEDVLLRTRKNYSGPLEAGEDLMAIEIGDEVKVSKFVSPASKPLEIIQ
jgi:ribonuclease Z